MRLAAEQQTLRRQCRQWRDPVHGWGGALMYCGTPGLVGLYALLRGDDVLLSLAWLALLGILAFLAARGAREQAQRESLLCQYQQALADHGEVKAAGEDAGGAAANA